MHIWFIFKRCRENVWKMMKKLQNSLSKSRSVKVMNQNNVYRMTYWNNTHDRQAHRHLIPLQFHQKNVSWHLRLATMVSFVPLMIFLSLAFSTVNWSGASGDNWAEYKNTGGRADPETSNKSLWATGRQTPEKTRFADFEGIVSGRRVQMVLLHLLSWQPHFKK